MLRYGHGLLVKACWDGVQPCCEGPRRRDVGGPQWERMRLHVLQPLRRFVLYPSAEDTVSSGSSDSGGSAGQVVRPRAASAPADLGSPPRSPPPIRRRLSLASRGPGLRSAGSSLPSSSACPGRAGAASSGRAAVPPPGGSDGRPPRPRGMPGLSTASRCFVQPERVIQSEVERISSCSG